MPLARRVLLPRHGRAVAAKPTNDLVSSLELVEASDPELVTGAAMRSMPLTIRETTEATKEKRRSLPRRFIESAIKRIRNLGWQRSK